MIVEIVFTNLHEFVNNLGSYVLIWDFMCRSDSRVLKTAQMLIGPFVRYGLLQNFKRSHEGKETLVPVLQHIRLGAMDTSLWLNEW